MNVVEKIILYYAKYKKNQTARKLACADNEQEKLFKKFKKRFKSSIFLKEHGIEGNMMSYDTFASQIPISTYEEFFPYIDRMLCGQPNIVEKGIINQFAKSSGTTNARSKYIPLSKRHLHYNHYKAGFDMMLWSVAEYQNPHFMLGKMIATSGSFHVDAAYPKARLGDISTYIVYHLPWYGRFFRSVHKDIFIEADWQKKIYALVSLSKTQDVRNLVGTPTWIVHMLDEVLKQTGKQTVLEVWPKLSMFFHGAVRLEPYKKIIEQKIGKPLFCMNIYNASEGYIGFQYHKDIADQFVLLTHHDIFYECILLSDVHKGVTVACPLKDVELNTEYALVITTTGGLVRYNIGDTVRFVSKNPYIFYLSGRTKQYLNTCGEEVSIENIETALCQTADDLGNEVQHFTVTTCMNPDGTAYHVWCIEYRVPPPSLILFTETLDQNLKQKNSDYEAKRTHDYILLKPQIIIVHHGTFEKWLASKNKLGGQYKIPRITENKEYINELVAISQSIT